MIFYSKKNNLASRIVASRIVKAFESIFGDTYPADKYKIVKELLEYDDIEVTETDEAFSDDDLLLVHSEDMVSSLNCVLDIGLKGTVLEGSELPFYSSFPFKGYFTGIGYATHLAAEYALENGCAVNLGGGFHHCKSDEAGSCCLINDVAVSIAKLRDEIKKNLKVLIIDLDLHQGDGNAEIFYNNQKTYIFSIHRNGIYPNPEDKMEVSDKDVGLWDKSPTKYLKALTSFLKNFKALKPDIIYYIAGADPYKEDTWPGGGLGLTMKDLQKRDQLVYEFACDRNIPIVTVLGGGYADVDKVAKIHYNTIKTMLDVNQIEFV